MSRRCAVRARAASLFGLSPDDVWAHAGVMHDSNVLRTQTDERSDNIARLGGGMTIDQRVAGRQRVRLDARADYYKYDKSTTLDHWAYALLGDWLWEIGNNLSGELLAGYDQRQVDMGETLTERLDLVTTKRAAATAARELRPIVAQYYARSRASCDW